MPYSPVKTFTSYLFQKTGWSSKLFTTKTTIPLNEWKVRSESTLERIAQDYPIKLTKDSTAKFVCKAPLKIGPVYSKVKQPSISSMIIFDSDLISKKYQRDLSQDLYISGGWDSNQRHVGNFSNGKMVNDEIDLYDNIDLINRLTRRFNNIPLLQEPSRVYSYFGEFKADSGCGGETSYSFKSAEKGFINYNKAADIIYKMFDKGIPSGVPMWIIGGKGRPMVGKKRGDIFSTRAIMQEDKVIFSLQKPFVKAIEDWLFEDDCGPIKLGKSSSSYKFENIYFLRKIYKWSIEIDYTFYDSTLPRDKIVAAFAFCRSLFPPSLKTDRLFAYFCRHFLEKNCVLPDGNVVLLRRGTPSGSAWTSVINSVANCLICEKILKSYRAFGSEDSTYYVNGDDTELFFMDQKNINQNKLVKWVKRKFDMDMKIEYVGPTITDDPDNAPMFLKATTSYVNDIAITSCPPKVIVKRLAVPANFPNTSVEFTNQVVEQSNNLIQHPQTIDVLSDIITARALDCDPDIDRLHTKKFWQNYIISRQNKIFLNKDIIGDDDYESRVKYKGLKVKILNNIDNCESIDKVYLTNWIYDNVTGRGNIKKDIRLQYFERLMGDRFYLWKIFNDKPLLTPFVNWLKYGLPLRESVFMLSEYYKWDLKGKSNFYFLNRGYNFSVFSYFIYLLAPVILGSVTLLLYLNWYSSIIS